MAHESERGLRSTENPVPQKAKEAEFAARVRDGAEASVRRKSGGIPPTSGPAEAVSLDRSRTSDRRSPEGTPGAASSKTFLAGGENDAGMMPGWGGDVSGDAARASMGKSPNVQRDQPPPID